MSSPYTNDQAARAKTAALLHWKVVGPQFEPLHIPFQAQSIEFALAIDVISEETRALRVIAPDSFAESQALTSISEAAGARWPVR